MGYNGLWNNLDKFLYADHKTHLSAEDAATLKAPYGDERKSILQREISLLKPGVTVFTIGPKWKYIESLAAAFSLNTTLLYSYKPTPKNCVSEISSILGLKDTVVLWTYHPRYLLHLCCDIFC